MIMRDTTGASAGGLLTAADLRGKSTAWADRRREPRIPCSREIMVLPAPFRKGQPFRPVGLFDCSARGLGVVSPEPMEVGEQFVVELSLDGVRLAAYTVRHCTPAADGRHYNIGAAYSGLIGRAGCDPQEVIDATGGCSAGGP